MENEKFRYESEGRTRTLSSCGDGGGGGGGGGQDVPAKPGGLHIFLPRRPVRTGPDQQQTPQVLTSSQRFDKGYKREKSPDSPRPRYSAQAPHGGLAAGQWFGMSLKPGQSPVNNPQQPSQSARLTSSRSFGVSVEHGQPPLQMPLEGAGATFEVSRIEPGQSPCYGVVHVKVVQCEGALCKAMSHVGCRLGRAWHHLVTFAAFLRVFLAKWCPPKWLMALLVVVLLLVLSGRWRGRDGSGLLPTLPAVINATAGVLWQQGDSERLLRLEHRFAQLLEHMGIVMDKITRQLGEEREGTKFQMDRLESILQTLVSSPTTVPDQTTFISVRVREELEKIIYGHQLESNAAPPTSHLLHDLIRWLSHRYINEDDFQSALAGLEDRVQLKISQHIEYFTTGCAGTTLMVEDLKRIVKDVMRQYTLDQTGMADYALESAGGSILEKRCAETYLKMTAQVRILGIPVYIHNSPCTAIQPGNLPGNCWPFHGSQGSLAIKLSMKVVPTAFSLEHVAKALVPGQKIDSAPREFKVYGLDYESQEEGTLLGRYTYEEGGEPLQTYPASEENERAFEFVLLEVLSNWGNPNYTCVYRFRVHGMLPSEAPAARSTDLHSPSTDSGRSESTEGGMWTNFGFFGSKNPPNSQS